MSLRDADLTGVFAADPRRFELEVAHVKDATGELSRAGEAGASAPMLPALPAVGSLCAPDPCSCDEALSLRARLAAAAAGTVALHVVKSEGFWTIERWRDGVLVESYVGVATVADAMDRIGDWMRIGELQANLAGKGDER